MDEVSILLIPKSSSNHARIGSRTERLRVLKIAVNYVIFSCFLWVAPQKNLKRKPIQANEVLGRTLQQIIDVINKFRASQSLFVQPFLECSSFLPTYQNFLLRIPIHFYL